MKINCDNYKMAVDLIDSHFESALDLGCSDKTLKKYLPKGVKYQGLDNDKTDYFEGYSDVINYNIENGLSILKDDSYDVVFLLRVLQDIDNPSFLLKEAMRVAKKGVAVSMSNLYCWPYRLKYLFGKYPVHALYFFSDSTYGNRQKWLINYQSATNFIEKNTVGKKVISGNSVYNHKRLKIIGVIEGLLSRLWPNLFVDTAVFYIKK